MHSRLCYVWLNFSHFHCKKNNDKFTKEYNMYRNIYSLSIYKKNLRWRDTVLQDTRCRQRQCCRPFDVLTVVIFEHNILFEIYRLGLIRLRCHFKECLFKNIDCVSFGGACCSWKRTLRIWSDFIVSLPVRFWFQT